MEEEIETRNAIIEKTFLGFEDHGIFTAYITMQYDCGGQSFGGYSIDADFIKQVLETLELDSWEQVKGQKVRVKMDRNKIYSLGHFLKDKWFNPKEFYERRKREENDE